MSTLSNLGIKALNNMQLGAQSAVKNKAHTILLSPTGSGKTIAFLLPLIDLLDKDIRAIQCLIIVPSRELALQIEQVWKKMNTGFKVNVCYGGHSIDTEINNLSDPPALLIGTPGRLNDHFERKTFETHQIRTLILDEFDKSLQLGFHEDMNLIIEQLYNIEKKILVSATSDIDIPDFVGIENAETLDYTQEERSEKLSIKLVVSKEKDKIESLVQLICSLNSEPALIFCNHREVAERVSDLLNQEGIQAGFYHGGMDQDDRERILIQFRNGSLNYLIATDLAARGLDIPEMKHVIHYHLPSKEDEFTHRNGRTARMKNSGTAYILVSKEEKLSEYIDPQTSTLQPKGGSIPQKAEYLTIYISGGKKNKLNKGDIVGFFIQKGKIKKEDIGMIEVKDFISFVAIRRSAVKNLLSSIKEEKMKGKKYKIEVARDVIRESK